MLLHTITIILKIPIYNITQINIIIPLTFAHFPRKNKNSTLFLSVHFFLRMFATNAASNLFFPGNPSSFRCRAAAGDLSAGPSFIQSVAGGLRIGQFPDGAGLAVEGRRGGGGNEPIRVKKWSRKNESYLDNDAEPLPLPMTYPDSSPVSQEEIDKRLQCDPQIQVLASTDYLFA